VNGAGSVEVGPEAVNFRSLDPVDGAWLPRWLGRVQRAVLPPCCLLCGFASETGSDLCAGCRSDLPANSIACPVCALPLATPADRCGRCLKRAPPFERARIPFRYGWPLDRLVMRFKFDADLAAGRVLAEAFVDAIGRERGGVEAIVPVPLHWKRLRQRGFNQSLELAKRIGRGLRMPVMQDALVRTRATEAQSGLDAVGRRRNVRGAFVARVAVSPLLQKARCVALLDDVVTTGATAIAAASALRRAGVRHVELWAIARAPSP
jgi:ComF family protein